MIWNKILSFMDDTDFNRPKMHDRFTRHRDQTGRTRPVGTYLYYMEKERLSACDRVMGKGFQEMTGKFYKSFTAAEL